MSPDSFYLGLLLPAISFRLSLEQVKISILNVIVGQEWHIKGTQHLVRLFRNKKW